MGLLTLYISHATNSCEGTTTSFGLSKLGIEMQGSTEFRNPQTL